jgi:hypothetical protein
LAGLDALNLDIRLKTLSIDKIDENSTRNTPVTFRVNVKFDESSRKVEETAVDFGITVTTEPNISRLNLEGTTVVKGKAEEIERVFETPSDSKVPNLLFEIYDRLYSAIYVTSMVVDVPCPSPGLLKSAVSGERASPESASEDVSAVSGERASPESASEATSDL